MKQDRVTRLMVCRDEFFLIRDQTALLFRADSNLDERCFDIFLNGKRTLVLGRVDRRLIEQVFQIRTGESCCRLRDLFQIDIICQWFIACMHFQNFFPAAHIRPAHDDLPVKTARTKDRGIQNVHAVRGRHHDDPLIHAETVHLDKQLVERLLTLIVTAAHTGASAPAHGIDLVNEHNAGRILLCLGKQITYTAGADTDEHLDEIRTGNREERHARFPGNGFGQQRFAGSGRTHQDHTLRDPCPDFGIFGRIFQEIHDLFQIFFFFLHTRDIAETDLTLLAGGHGGAAAAEIHHPLVAAARSAAHLAVHEHHKEKNADAYDNKRPQHRPHGTGLRYIGNRVFHSLFFQLLFGFRHIADIDAVSLLFTFDRKGNGTGRHFRILRDLCFFYLSLFQIFQKSAVRYSISPHPVQTRQHGKYKDQSRQNDKIDDTASFTL